MAIIQNKDTKYEMTELTMQWFLSNNHFKWQSNVIIPNVSYGAGIGYEIDLLVITSSLYCHEIEIKVSKSDIKNDMLKSKHAHKGPFVKYFSYAVPEKLKDCEYLPLDVGLIVVKENGRCYTERAPRINRLAKKLSPEQYNKMLRLCNFRMWNLKRKEFTNFIYRKKTIMVNG